MLLFPFFAANDDKTAVISMAFRVLLRRRQSMLMK